MGVVIIATGINKFLQFQEPKNLTDYIKNFISDFESSRKRKEMKEAKAYYRSKNIEIMNRTFYVYAEDEQGNPRRIKDPYKANNKLPSGFFKILVDQKINYLLGNDMAIETDDKDELQEIIDPENLQYKLRKTAKDASKKSVGWLQLYVDNEGNFGYKKIDSEQVIPVYKPNNKDELEFVIRYYKIRVLNDKNEMVSVNRVEVWDEEEVAFFQENFADNLYYILEPEYMAEDSAFTRPYENPRYHFQRELVINQTTHEREDLAWGRVPFVPLYNNDEEDTDLNPIKAFIDAYDLINSDFVNNLEDHVDVHWVLKGYQGENLTDFLDMVKKYHAIKVAHDGEVRQETTDIPTEARKTDIKQLERDIFKFGQGVNPLEFDSGNVTNVMIKARFALLDLKCDQFEDKVQETLRRFFEFVNRYREIEGQEPIEIKSINFDRSMIMNKKEMLDANKDQHGHISEPTRLANHPYVDDVEKEQGLMDEDIMDRIDLDNVEMPEEDEEGDE